MCTHMPIIPQKSFWQGRNSLSIKQGHGSGSYGKENPQWFRFCRFCHWAFSLDEVMDVCSLDFTVWSPMACTVALNSSIMPGFSDAFCLLSQCVCDSLESFGLLVLYAGHWVGLPVYVVMTSVFVCECADGTTVIFLAVTPANFSWRKDRMEATLSGPAPVVLATMS